HRLGGGIPDALRMGARERQRPQERDGRRTQPTARLAEAEEIVDAVVPALARPRLHPDALGLEPPARAAQPLPGEPVEADPLAAGVAVAKHEPEIAVGREHAAPLAPEPDGEASRVATRRRTALVGDPVGRRGKDNADTARGDRTERSAVALVEPRRAVAARKDGHSGDGTSSPATPP